MVYNANRKIPENLLFSHEWKEGGQNQPSAIKYKGKKHPIKSKVKGCVLHIDNMYY